MYNTQMPNSCIPIYSCNRNMCYDSMPNPYYDPSMMYQDYGDKKMASSNFHFFDFIKKNKNVTVIVLIVAIVAYIYNDYKKKYKNLQVKIIKKKSKKN